MNPGSILGSSVRRREDPRLVDGGGLFTDDHRLEGALHAVFARSSLAHAELVGIDTRVALGLPGVVAVWAAADLKLAPRMAFAILDEAYARPPLATDRVRFVGEAIAVVAADSPQAAADAALAVIPEYGPLPVVLDPEAALGEDAPLLFPGSGTNLCFEFGEDGAEPLDANLITVGGRFRNQRLAAVPMEGNALAARPDGRGGLEVWASTQSPFQLRDAIADALGLAEGQVRVRAPNVGGGFGAKISVYPEQIVVAALALRLGRPVRWSETRTENLLAMNQGRGQIQDVRLAADSEGIFQRLSVSVIQDAGAYPEQGAFLPFFSGQMASGVYRIPEISFRARSAATNLAPVAAYRGAGRPEATSLIERLVDMLARRLRIDPAELRRRNLIEPQDMPHTTVTGATYDTGDYPAALARAMELAGYDRLRLEQAARRRSGGHLQLGIGLSTYVEVTAVGSPTEFGSVEIRPGGSALVLAGTTATGQGHQTSLAQIAAETLELSLEQVSVLESDTGIVSRGDGTSGSRSMQLAGSAVLEAALKVVELGRARAAGLFEADGGDMVLGALGFHVAGVLGGRSIGWAELAASGPGLEAQVDFVQADQTYPFGCHISVVEVDLETGVAVVLSHTAVDDCGRVINPLLAEGQVHGGIAQGLGQALYEEVLHDGEGNPLTATLVDYSIPGIGEIPDLLTAFQQTPTPNNPLGAKGIGESGTIGSTAAIQNAILDALSHLGVTHLDMPLHPERVWRAVGAALGTGVPRAAWISDKG